MNTFIIFAIFFAILGSCLGNEEREKMKERGVNFYKCLACATDEAHAAYAKCEQLKPNKSKIHLEECCKKVIPEEDHVEEAKHWQYYCDNPVYIGKVLDCLFTEEYLKSLTDEDMSALKKFKDCAKGIKEQYCNEA
ncbi:uncharacterized protein TNCT_653191 [Trichonephila clavata]|uniref:Uncharacterized protein n=1 Tax=Trichonephila clavata TaxID=2740835 RepID=A0A8X6KWL7_TRICU|nr:uncharacterized protein TNCT_653191 [Trichonephila clavata]